MATLLLFNKPFEVLSQFTDDQGRSTLADHIKQKGLYPAGRLDFDSEGLMLLTDNGKAQNWISSPKHKQSKSYWVQVEGVPSPDSLKKLSSGVLLNDGLTRPAQARIIAQPDIWPRDPPIRERKTIPTTWLEITLKEGRNRQVRRMTAAVGHPTLRLIRHRIGQWQLDDLLPGQSKAESINLPRFA